MKSKRLFCGLLSLGMAMGLIGCAPFSSSVASAQTVTYFDLFDTVSRVTVYDKQDGFAQEAERFHAFLLDYHRLYDIYTAYEGLTNLKTVNDAAGGEPVAVDERILDLLERGKEACEATGGRVNICYGAVLEQWHACRLAAEEDPESLYLPEETALQKAAEHVSPDSLVLNREAGTVCITDPAVRLDVGAIAKGYATEMAAVFARDVLGWKSAVLDIGGNVRVLGDKNGKPFRIGITDPAGAEQTAYAAVVNVRDSAVVTSGDYQRYFTVDGKRYAHIIDPDTAYPAEHVRSVTVVGPDSGTADLLSTALFTLPTEAGQRLLSDFPDYQALWIGENGETAASPGWDTAVAAGTGL